MRSLFFLRRSPGALWAAILLTAAVAAHADPPAAPPRRRATFLTISDIHFGPFTDSALAGRLLAADHTGWRAIYEGGRSRGLGNYGEEAGYPLLKSLLENMRRAEPEPGFIILTGDLLAHDFRGTFNRYAVDRSDSAYDRFVYKTIGFLATMIELYFPRTPVIPALGNNDSYSGNYSVGPRSRFLADFRALWAPLVGRTGDGGSFARDFPVGGYYAVADPTVKRRRIIALNTIFFSAKYCNRCDAAGRFCTTCDTAAPYPGDIELAWLDAELAAADERGERVWLAYHIPPGVDVFGSVDSAGSCGEGIVPFWRKSYEEQFHRLMRRYASTIDAAFAGHTHMDDFRLLSDSVAPFGFVHITPAVSPIYNNNPGFQLFQLDSSGDGIEDYATYFLDLAARRGRAWRKEYEFRSAYRAGSYNLAELTRLYRGILSSPAIRERYMRHYAVGSRHRNSLTDRNWHGYGCGIGHLGAAEFGECCADRE